MVKNDERNSFAVFDVRNEVKEGTLLVCLPQYTQRKFAEFPYIAALRPGTVFRHFQLIRFRPARKIERNFCIVHRFAELKMLSAYRIVVLLLRK